MIQECLDVFKEIEKRDPRFPIRNRIPKNGTYYLINIEKNTISDPIEINYDKKEDDYKNKPLEFSYINELDFYSNMLNANKAIDAPKKKVHSNNMYSIFFKEENVNEMKDLFIENYYNALEKIDDKNKKIGKEFIKKYGEINVKELNKNKNFIIKNFDKIIKKDSLSGDDKRYIKIFIVKNDKEETINDYKREYLRYMYQYAPLKPSLTYFVGKEAFAPPTNFISYNSKKPFIINNLGFKSPFSIKVEDAIKLVELSNLMEFMAKKNYYTLYVDIYKKEILYEEDVSNYFRGYKIYFDYVKNLFTITNAYFFNKTIIPLEIDVKEYIKLKHKNNKESYDADFYGLITDSEKLIKNINLIFFFKNKNKRLEEKYRGKIDKMVLENGEYSFLEKMIEDYIHFNVKNNSNKSWSLILQFNYYINLKEHYGNKKGEFMDLKNVIIKKIKNEEELTSDEEILYAMGQVLRKIQYYTREKDKNMNFIIDFINCKDPDKLKDKFARKIRRHSYIIKAYKYMENPIIAQILMHDFSNKVDYKMIMAGYLDNNILFKKEESEEEI